MNKMIMMVGLPGSGKSFYAEKIAEKENAIIISSDNIREELFGDVNHQDDNNKVFKELHQRIKQNLNNNKNVIYDATNISYKKRKVFLDQLKDIDCEKICIFVATPYKKCLEQNNLRERKVPEHVIKRMYMNFYIPQHYEGWNIIGIILNEKYNDFSDLFKRLETISQDNPHHELTIGSHCMACASQMYKHQDLTLYYSALFHDIGKEFTKTFTNMKGEKTDIAHYYQHHLVSAYETIFYLFDRKDILDIVKYITWHMQPFFIQTEKAKNKLINLIGQECYDKLMLLHEADKNSKSWRFLNVN